MALAYREHKGFVEFNLKESCDGKYFTEILRLLSMKQKMKIQKYN